MEIVGQVQRISRVAPFSLPHLTTTATRCVSETPPFGHELDYSLQTDM